MRKEMTTAETERRRAASVLGRAFRGATQKNRRSQPHVRSHNSHCIIAPRSFPSASRSANVSTFHNSNHPPAHPRLLSRQLIPSHDPLHLLPAQHQPFQPLCYPQRRPLSATVVLHLYYCATARISPAQPLSIILHRIIVYARAIDRKTEVKSNPIVSLSFLPPKSRQPFPSLCPHPSPATFSISTRYG